MSLYMFRALNAHLQEDKLYTCSIWYCHSLREFVVTVPYAADGFGGLVVSILATGTRVRGFKPGRSLWIFRYSEKSSVCLPSEGK
jgi:hypothetical protein